MRRKRLKATSSLEKTASSRIKPYVEQGKPFTLRKIAEECGIDLDYRSDYTRIYQGVIVRWRDKALEAFEQIDVEEMLTDGMSMEDVWGVFLDMINARGIYLLFALGNDRRTGEYVQPSWLEKEIIDFTRWRRQLSGNLKVLVEMDQYGEDFPADVGINKSPREIVQGLADVLSDAKFTLEGKIKKRIEALTSPPEEDDSEENEAQVQKVKDLIKREPS